MLLHHPDPPSHATGDAVERLNTHRQSLRLAEPCRSNTVSPAKWAKGAGAVLGAAPSARACAAGPSRPAGRRRYRTSHAHTRMYTHAVTQHTQTRVHSHTCTVHTHSNTYIHTYAHARTLKHVHTIMHTRVQTRVHTATQYTCTHKHVCTRSHTYTCAHTLKHMRSHAYT